MNYTCKLLFCFITLALSFTKVIKFFYRKILYMATKSIQFGDINYLETLPVLDNDPKKARYERKIREKNALQNYKSESFGLLQDQGTINPKNTKLVEPMDITTLYHTWKNDSGSYGGKQKRKTRKNRTKIIKKSRKSRKSRKHKK